MASCEGGSSLRPIPTFVVKMERGKLGFDRGFVPAREGPARVGGLELGGRQVSLSM